MLGLPQILINVIIQTQESVITIKLFRTHNWDAYTLRIVFRSDLVKSTKLLKDP